MRTLGAWLFAAAVALAQGDDWGIMPPVADPPDRAKLRLETPRAKGWLLVKDDGPGRGLHLVKKAVTKCGRRRVVAEIVVSDVASSLSTKGASKAWFERVLEDYKSPRCIVETAKVRAGRFSAYQFTAVATRHRRSTEIRSMLVRAGESRTFHILITLDARAGSPSSRAKTRREIEKALASTVLEE